MPRRSQHGSVKGNRVYHAEIKGCPAQAHTPKATKAIITSVGLLIFDRFMSSRAIALSPTVELTRRRANSSFRLHPSSLRFSPAARVQRFVVRNLPVRSEEHT